MMLLKNFEFFFLFSLIAWRFVCVVVALGNHLLKYFHFRLPLKTLLKCWNVKRLSRIPAYSCNSKCFYESSTKVIQWDDGRKLEHSLEGNVKYCGNGNLDRSRVKRSKNKEEVMNDVSDLFCEKFEIPENYDKTSQYFTIF
jgi:hypothetical protein